MHLDDKQTLLRSERLGTLEIEGDQSAGRGKHGPAVIVGEEPFRENALIDHPVHVAEGNARDDGSLRRPSITPFEFR